MLLAIQIGGATQYPFSLSGRGHGVALFSKSNNALVFARRPGKFGIVFDPRTGNVRSWILAPLGLHFCGHGVFSDDVRTLYTTENEYASGKGRIGVWDAANNFSRVETLFSHGIGPHELCLSYDGKYLVIANGGIRTHPSTGREKLNIATMEPSLAIINRITGSLLTKFTLKNARQQKLSIRHVVVGMNGMFCAVMQDQAPDRKNMPLVAFCRSNVSHLFLGAAPRHIQMRMRGYTGSVALDCGGVFAGVTAPHGNLVTIWDLRTGSYISHTNFSDVCGISSTHTEGEFVMTSGIHGAATSNVPTGKKNPLPSGFISGRSWYNHLLTARAFV